MNSVFICAYVCRSFLQSSDYSSMFNALCAIDNKVVEGLLEETSAGSEKGTYGQRLYLQ